MAEPGDCAEDHFQVALSHRTIIGQAQGILMERFKVNAEQAFQMLLRTSQDNHRKLFAIAEALAATGEWAAD